MSSYKDWCWSWSSIRKCQKVRILFFLLKIISGLLCMPSSLSILMSFLKLPFFSNCSSSQNIIKRLFDVRWWIIYNCVYVKFHRGNNFIYKRLVNGKIIDDFLVGDINNDILWVCICLYDWQIYCYENMTINSSINYPIYPNKYNRYDKVC